MEDIITTKFIPTLTGHPPPNDSERELFALPARLGGMGLINPAQRADLDHQASIKVTSPLSQSILSQQPSYTNDVMTSQLTVKSEVRSTKKRISMATEAASLLKERLPSDLQMAIDLAAEKGAPSWLTTLPIEDHGFTLHKGAFQDALALRYNWTPSRLPSTCACGSSHSIEHALSCPKGGHPSIRHNEIRDLTAHLMT